MDQEQSTGISATTDPSGKSKTHMTKNFQSLLKKNEQGSGSSNRKFPLQLVIKVATSEPRDVLQSERTCINFLRFTTSLFFTALGVLFNFRIDTSGDQNKKHHDRGSTYSNVIAFILLFLAAVTSVISVYNYFESVNSYARGKIRTHAYNTLPTMICMTGIVISLATICIISIVKEYTNSS